MFLHNHPYKPIIFKDTEKLIVGTLPPPRFSTGDLMEKDVNFPYGSHYNSLWSYIDKIHDLNLRYDNSKEAVEQRRGFLEKHKIGICDIVESAEREKIDASDLGMTNVKLRDIIDYLNQFPKINTLLFTGGNSKNGPEYFFRRHLKKKGIKLNLVSNEIPRIHEFILKDWTGKTTRIIKSVSLTSASGAANRAVGSIPLYKQMKSRNPDFTTFDFRVLQYREYF